MLLSKAQTYTKGPLIDDQTNTLGNSACMWPLSHQMVPMWAEFPSLN